MRSIISTVVLATSSLLLLVENSVVVAYDWRCNLHCYNDGECKHGNGKFGSFSGFEEDNTDILPFAEQDHFNGMYCSCPIGWTGLQCEIKVIVCGENGIDQHTCFNGEPCAREKTDKGKTFFRCECDANKSDMSHSYASKYCEHISTTFCHHRKGDSSLSDTNSFCTNGGRCKETSGHGGGAHAGCICPPGWEGSHCEFHTTTLELQALEAAAKKHKKTITLVIVFIVLFALIGMGFWIYIWLDRTNRMNKKRKSKLAPEHQEYHDSPYGDKVPPPGTINTSYSDRRPATDTDGSPRDII